MTKSEAVAVPEYVHKAQAKKLRAEAKAAATQARLNALACAGEELGLEATEIKMESVRLARQYEDAQDARLHIYRFTGQVDSASTAKCMEVLTRWSRMEPECDMEIVFFSPGGSVVDGMALFDTIMQLRKVGHKITTTCIGYAASMGGILLQAGDIRQATPESWILVHQISASAMGSMGEITDRVKWLERVQERILDIFAKRAFKAKGKKAITRDQLKKNWERVDWWVSSDEALALGLIDEII